MSVKNKARDRLPGGRLKSYRREVRRLLNQVMRGHDADGIAFPVSHRPFVYWW